MHAYKKKIKGDISSGIRITGVSSTFGNLFAAAVVLKTAYFLVVVARCMLLIRQLRTAKSQRKGPLALVSTNDGT